MKDTSCVRYGVVSRSEAVPAKAPDGENSRVWVPEECKVTPVATPGQPHDDRAVIVICQRGSAASAAADSVPKDDTLSEPVPTAA